MEWDQYRIDPFIPMVTIGMEIIIPVLLELKGEPVLYSLVFVLGCDVFLLVSWPLWIIKKLTIHKERV